MSLRQNDLTDNWMNAARRKLSKTMPSIELPTNKEMYAMARFGMPVWMEQQLLDYRGQNQHADGQYSQQQSQLADSTVNAQFQAAEQRRLRGY